MSPVGATCPCGSQVMQGGKGPRLHFDGTGSLYRMVIKPRLYSCWALGRVLSMENPESV